MEEESLFELGICGRTAEQAVCWNYNGASEPSGGMFGGNREKEWGRGQRKKSSETPHWCEEKRENMRGGGGQREVHTTTWAEPTQRPMARHRLKQRGREQRRKSGEKAKEPKKGRAWVKRSAGVFPNGQCKKCTVTSTGVEGKRFREEKSCVSRRKEESWVMQRRTLNGRPGIAQAGGRELSQGGKKKEEWKPGDLTGFYFCRKMPQKGVREGEPDSTGYRTVSKRVCSGG